MKEQIVSQLRESAELKLRFAKESVAEIEIVIDILIKSLKSGGKILLFGNGGSAADAQHIAAELVNRFLKERKALAALSLATDTSVITSIANDSNFDKIFSRQVEAIGKKGDVAWGFTTSGRSTNVLNALKIAKTLELKTIAFTGSDDSRLKKMVDCCIRVPSDSTPRVQELHISIAHIICDLVENFFKKK